MESYASPSLSATGACPSSPRPPSCRRSESRSSTLGCSASPWDYDPAGNPSRVAIDTPRERVIWMYPTTVCPYAPTRLHIQLTAADTLVFGSNAGSDVRRWREGAQCGRVFTRPTPGKRRSREHPLPFRPRVHACGPGPRSHTDRRGTKRRRCPRDGVLCGTRRRGECLNGDQALESSSCSAGITGARSLGQPTRHPDFHRPPRPGRSVPSCAIHSNAGASAPSR